jgi:hypothetical protein
MTPASTFTRMLGAATLADGAAFPVAGAWAETMPAANSDIHESKRTLMRRLKRNLPAAKRRLLRFTNADDPMMANVAFGA